MKKLAEIQRKLVAPKTQTNTFGKYKYRSCEDILEAVKPLLGDATLVIRDELVLIGERYYIRAQAILSDGDDTASSEAFAREEETKKGMDAAQITGSASSYARKYALNGLFCIDDNKDPDATNKHEEEEPPFLSTDQITEINDKIRELEINENAFLGYLCKALKTRIETIEDIPASGYSVVLAAIKAKENKK